MTVTEMHAAMGRMLDDESEARWTGDIKNQALNAAQMRVIKYLPSDLLPELQASKASLSVPASGYALSGIASDPGPFLPGRYVNCYVSSENTWAGWTWIDSMEEREQNTFRAGSDSAPLAYVFGETLFVLLETYPATVTLYYVRQPKEMVESGASGYQVETCELDETRHDLVTEAAAAQILRWEGETADAQRFEQHVGSELLAEIQTFTNEKHRRTRRS